MSETSLQQQIPAGEAASAQRRIGRSGRYEGRSAWAPVAIGWRYRELILAILRRQLADRFSGSLFGWGWAIAAPLITLAIYTVTFASALRLPVASARGGTVN